MGDFVISTKVKDEEFRTWLKRTENAFVYMINTMIDVATVIKENTLPLTPVKTSRLVRSFKWTILADNSRMKILQLSMSAINPRDGYNYAWIQHEEESYDHRKYLGKWSKFHRDYFGYPYYTSGYRYFTRHENRYALSDRIIFEFDKATHHYLQKGIEMSMDDAFMLIEEDYLSLFNRGYIF